ncbi:MAG: Gfo/Idh/MocA family oxidoreductase [Alphaproteobacteria bacterium]
MTETLLRVGIAGYGVVGQRRRQFIDRHPALKTVAVCDRALDGEGAFADGVRHYAHYSRLLAAESLDLLFVCLTNDVAAEVTIAGLEKGLHVFCEKPPGRDIADIVRVIACERRHPGLRLKYGFNHRYHDSVREALKLVRSGELGRVVNMRGIYGKSAIINFQSDWRTRRAIAGGGILLDQGIHMVDLLRLFAGDFTEIHSVVSNDFWRHDVEDNAYALMRTADGVVAMLHSSATQWRHRFELDMALEKGTVILSGILSGSKSYGAETLTVAWAAENDAGNPREQTTRYNHDPSWADEIAEFADAVRTGAPIVDGSSEEALRTMHLVYRIYCADPAWRARWALTDDVPPEFLTRPQEP